MNLAAWAVDTGTNPGAVAALGEEGLVSAMEAMLRGAMTPGKAGFSDRQTLWRMCGFTWAQTTGSKADRQKGGNAELGARHAAALARREAQYSRPREVIEAIAEPGGSAGVTEAVPVAPDLEF